MSLNINLCTVGALCAVLCACAGREPPTSQLSATKPTITVQPPRGEAGDFIICDDGRVLVFAVSHPKSCT
jgi:hypothetical protein